MKVTLREVHRAGARVFVASAVASAMILPTISAAHGAVLPPTTPRNNGYPGGSGPASAANTGPTSIQVPTSANLDPASSKTHIECAWALPDLNAKGGAETSNSVTTAVNFTGNPFYGGTPPATPPSLAGPNGFSYGIDDDPSVTPTPGGATSPGTPCDLGTGAGQVTAGSAVQADLATHMIQVLPNADDLPAQRRIELWAAVDDTSGLGTAAKPQISDVYWDIFKPDGTLKFQVHGVPVPPAGTNGTLSSCGGPAGMFTAAIGNGEVTSNAVYGPGGTASNPTTPGMIALCEQNVKELWHNAWTISKDQPNGVYKVVTHAVDAGGAISSLTYFVDIIPFFALGIDFSAVNFGAIVPNGSSTVSGDTNYNPPNSTTPTVTNMGNSGEQIGVQSSPMIGTVNGKCISNFDAALGLNPSNLEHVIYSATCTPQTPSAVQWFAVNGSGPGKQVLCPNDDAKLDLSVEPGSVPTDAYTGWLKVWAQSSVTTGAGKGGCPTDNGSDYTPNSGVRT